MIASRHNFVVHFDFGPDVPVAQLKDTIVLATMAAETLFGTERVELETRIEHDVVGPRVSIYSPTEVGRSLATIFLGFCRREFGSRAIKVSHGGRGTD